MTYFALCASSTSPISTPVLLCKASQFGVTAGNRLDCIMLRGAAVGLLFIYL